MSVGDPNNDISSVIQGTERARLITDGKVQEIQQVNANLRMLAFNALFEAKRAGELGAGFGVVADEVKGISSNVDLLAKSLSSELVAEISSLEDIVKALVANANGKRLVDLSLNAIELIDRNLFERTCDVRWWATDSALVNAASDALEDNTIYASKRLGVILDAYTVYVDLWLCDMNGRVIANGRPNRFPIVGEDVSTRPWYKAAARLSSGDQYVVDDVTEEYLLENAKVATYAASVRENGEANGKPVGVLGVHFDWEPQAASIVDGIKASDDEAKQTSVLLVDAKNSVIASSSQRYSVGEKVDIRTQGQNSGFYTDKSGATIGFHMTPGYETYEGLGWKGVIIQQGSQ